MTVSQIVEQDCIVDSICIYTAYSAVFRWIKFKIHFTCNAQKSSEVIFTKKIHSAFKTSEWGPLCLVYWSLSKQVSFNTYKSPNTTQFNMIPKFWLCYFTSIMTTNFFSYLPAVSFIQATRTKNCKLMAYKKRKVYFS